MKRILQGIAVISVLAVLAIGLSFGADRSDLSECARCGKAMDPDSRFSVVQKGTSKPAAFDDIGCALLWREDQCISIQMTFDGTARAYDYYSGEEVLMKDALFVRSASLHTPAGYGIAAFSTREGAEKFLKEKGGEKVLTFDELLLLNLR